MNTLQTKDSTKSFWLKITYVKRLEGNNNNMVAAGESTPLLGGSSSSSPPQAQEDDTTSPLLAAASAPPPADAPPPLPDEEEEEEAPLKDGKTSSSSSWWHKKQDSIDTNAINDDTSQSQLSLSQSKKRRSKKNKRSGGGDASATTTTSKRSKSNTKKKKKNNNTYDGPKKTICHLSFDIVRYLAIVASCTMLIMQIIPIVILNESGSEGITGLQYFVRVYLIIFCVSFVLLESRIPLLRQLSFPAHDNWILRGFMYTFIGIIGMEQDVAIKVEDIASGTSNILGPGYGVLFASLAIAITTWIMVGVGVLYMVLGVMCLQKWYERLEKDHNDKLVEWKRKKKREKEVQKDKEEYMKSQKDRREGRGEWYDDIESLPTGG